MSWEIAHTANQYAINQVGGSQNTIAAAGGIGTNTIAAAGGTAVNTIAAAGGIGVHTINESSESRWILRDGTWHIDGLWLTDETWDIN